MNNERGKTVQNVETTYKIATCLDGQLGSSPLLGPREYSFICRPDLENREKFSCIMQQVRFSQSVRLRTEMTAIGRSLFNVLLTSSLKIDDLGVIRSWRTECSFSASRMFR